MVIDVNVPINMYTRMISNKVPDNYAKVAVLNPLKMQFRKIPHLSNNRPLSGKYITTFVLSLSHPTGEIFIFKNQYSIGK